MHVLKRWAAWLRDNRRVVGIAAAVIIGGLVIAWVLFVPVADWLATHDVAQARGVTAAMRTMRLQTARDSARGRLLTLGAGVLAAGALWFTAKNFTLARHQLDVSRQAMEITGQGQQRTLQLTEQGQVTDRYTKAIEQLGSDKPDVRIGGIYALERVARDSPRDHPTVMEVLAAFIREHSREPRPEAEPGAQPPRPATRPDVQAAVTVIVRRNREHDQRSMNLADAQLFNVDLSGANLTGADLTEADISYANLRATELTNASLHLANLTGSDLSGAKLTNADLNLCTLTGANLTGADLTGATLFAADLRRANLTCVDIIAGQLADANLTDADLTDATWQGVGMPKGWVRDPGSDRLRRVGDDTGNTSN